MSTRFPVVSGFYKLLEVCMKICDKLFFFKTPFEIYETTNGGNFPVGASNQFLTPTEG